MATTKNGIYYPGNYESVADVPTDMKKMAESIDNKVEDINTRINGFKNYDDTEIKQGIATNKTNIQANAKKIEDIEKEQTEQNESIASKVNQADYNKAMLAIQAELLEVQEENKRLNNDIKASSLEGQEEGESLYLQDSSDARFREFTIEGNSKQETRSGKNKLNLSKIQETTKAGVTCTYNAEDNSVTFNGTCTENNTSWSIIGSIEAVQNKTTLTAVYVNGSFTVANESLSQARLFNAGYSRSITMRLAELAVNKKVSKTYTYNNDTLSNWSIRFDEGDVLDNFTFKLMVTDEVDTEYEDFGAMPSLEFPSKVEAVKDSVNVTVCNKNFWSHKSKKFTRSDVNWSDVVGTDAIWGKDITKKTDKFDVLQAGTYTASWKNQINVLSTHIIDDNENILINNKNGGTFVLKEETKVIARIRNKEANVETYGGDIQIEEGENATDYIPHEEQNFTMLVQQEMLKDDGFVKIDGTWKEKHTWGKYVITGKEGVSKHTSTTNNSFYIQLSSYIDVLPKCPENDSTVAEILCSHFPVDAVNTNVFKDKIGIGLTQLSSSRTCALYISVGLDGISTSDEFKAKLAELYEAGNPLTIYYKLETPIYLDCTEAQKAVAKQIRETLHSYKGGTHVYCTDETSAKFNVKYTVDPKAYIDAQLNPIIQELTGGN